MINNPVTAKIVAFLDEIGLPIEAAEVAGKTFVPGIQINHGRILFDEQTMLYPGDLLHEAGHLAVMTPEARSQAHIKAGDSPAEEMAAIAWSYAAALHIGIDPSVVFHADGYKGGSESLLENFREGRYLAVPMLQWLGFAYEAKNADAAGVQPYPYMLRWLRW
jgi:hypothetical protein